MHGTHTRRISKLARTSSLSQQMTHSSSSSSATSAPSASGGALQLAAFPCGSPGLPLRRLLPRASLSPQRARRDREPEALAAAAAISAQGQLGSTAHGKRSMLEWEGWGC